METVRLSVHRPPVMPLEMLDSAGTVLHIMTPSVDMVEKLQEQFPVLMTGEQVDSREGAIAAYGLAAQLMSRNLDGIQVTAEDIRDKYNLTRYDVLQFFSSYLDFLAKVKTAKN